MSAPSLASTDGPPARLMKLLPSSYVINSGKSVFVDYANWLCALRGHTIWITAKAFNILKWVFSPPPPTLLNNFSLIDGNGADKSKQLYWIQTTIHPSLPLLSPQNIYSGNLGVTGMNIITLVQLPKAYDITRRWLANRLQRQNKRYIMIF